MYNREMLESMGEIYKDLLKILNKTGNDPYSNTSDIFPFKCFMMVLKKATPLGIPKQLDKEIAALMDTISPEDVHKLMNDPLPVDLRMSWYRGVMGLKTAKDK